MISNTLMFCVLDLSSNISPAFKAKLSLLVIAVPDVFAMGKAKKMGGTGKPRPTVLFLQPLASSFRVEPKVKVVSGAVYEPPVTSDWPDIPLKYISDSDLVTRPSQKEEKKNKEEKKVVGSDLVRGVTNLTLAGSR